MWHRRSGKEKVDLNLTIKKTQERVGVYYYFFPTYNQGRKILWDGIDRNGFAFRNHFHPSIVKKFHTGEMKVEFKNGSLFQVVGIDNIDSIVGTNPCWGVFSEFSLQDPRGWNFIRPILAENDGTAIFNFTPRGKNHAYKLLEAAKNDPKWFAQVLTVDDTKSISKEVLEQERIEILRENGDDSLFQQEYYCSFTASLLGAYYNTQYATAEKLGRFTNVPYDPMLPVYTVWDLGIGDAMAIGFFQAAAFEVRMIDYIEVTGKSLLEMIKVVRDKPYMYGGHYAPHDIRVRELTTGKTRFETALSVGFSFNIAPDISVIDGIEAGKRLFSKLWVDKTLCARWLELIPQYTKEYDDDRHIFKDKPYHDWTSHGADMFRYAALVAENFVGGFQFAPLMTDSNPVQGDDMDRYRGFGLV